MIEFVCLAISAGIVFFLWKSRINYLLLGRLPIITDSTAPDLTVIFTEGPSNDSTAAATTKWLLFAAAGTTLDPRFAASAIHYAEENKYDLLTALLEQKCITIFEKMLLPYSLALCFIGFNARTVNGPADGQCLLFRRTAYREDVATLSIRSIRAEHLGSVRFRYVNPGGGIQIILASILLTAWLPALLLGLTDYPSPLTLQLLLTPTPVLLLFFAPFLTLLPWYRWRILLAPFAIYVHPFIVLKARRG
jgi:hypothetical protein